MKIHTHIKQYKNGPAAPPKYPEHLKPLFNAMHNNQIVPIIILKNGMAVEKFVATDYWPGNALNENYKSVDLVRGYIEGEIQNSGTPTAQEAVKTTFTMDEVHAFHVQELNLAEV